MKLKLIPLVTLVLLFTSCSNQKRIARFLKKVPPIEVAAVLVKDHPELFKPQTITIDTVITDTINVEVPQLKDSVIYSYNDTVIKNSDLQIEIRKGKLYYNVFPRTIEKIVKIPFYVHKEAQPCPQQSVIDHIVKENKDKDIEIAELKSAKKSLWIWILILISLLVIENLLLFKFKVF